MSENRTALVYDYDGTLATANVQEHSFIPEMGLTKEEFWAEVTARARQHDADEILTYMWYMLEVAREKGHPITRTALAAHGKGTQLFNGLDAWFDRMNSFGADLGLTVEHYIISSGNLELISASPIFDRFTRVYASKFIFDDAGNAVWPGLAINYTNKTQFLFRINKGIDNSWDSHAINQWIPMGDRPVPFERMIFFGDGATDIPAMKTVRHQGGCSIAVFDPGEFTEDATQEKISRLISEDRVHYVAPADYSPGSQLDVVTKGVLGRIARRMGRSS